MLQVSLLPIGVMVIFKDVRVLELKPKSSVNTEVLKIQVIVRRGRGTENQTCAQWMKTLEVRTSST